jgi:hypothetical protein
MDTNRTGWAKATVPMNWTDDTELEDNEWTECPPPNEGDDSGLDLDPDEIDRARREADKVAEICGR